MELSDLQKEIIESALVEITIYSETDKKERQKKGQYFTPAPLVIRMIEKFDNLEGKIMDPAAGSGNLIIGCILAGADPKLCYANELDPEQYKILIKNLTKYNVPKENITMLDALSHEFSAYLESLEN